MLETGNIWNSRHDVYNFGKKKKKKNSNNDIKKKDYVNEWENG